MAERSNILGNIIVGEIEHLDALRALDESALRVMFQSAAEQGMSVCDLNGTLFELRRNSDYTYHLAPQTQGNHWL